MALGPVMTGLRLPTVNARRMASSKRTRQMDPLVGVVRELGGHLDGRESERQARGGSLAGRGASHGAGLAPDRGRRSARSCHRPVRIGAGAAGRQTGPLAAVRRRRRTGGAEERIGGPGPAFRAPAAGAACAPNMRLLPRDGAARGGHRGAGAPSRLHSPASSRWSTGIGSIIRPTWDHGRRRSKGLNVDAPPCLPRTLQRDRR